MMDPVFTAVRDVIGSERPKVWEYIPNGSTFLMTEPLAYGKHRFIADVGWQDTNVDAATISRTIARRPDLDIKVIERLILLLTQNGDRETLRRQLHPRLSRRLER